MRGGPGVLRRHRGQLTVRRLVRDIYGTEGLRELRAVTSTQSTGQRKRATADRPRPRQDRPANANKLETWTCVFLTTLALVALNRRPRPREGWQEDYQDHQHRLSVRENEQDRLTPPPPLKAHLEERWASTFEIFLAAITTALIRPLAADQIEFRLLRLVHLCRRLYANGRQHHPAADLAGQGWLTGFTRSSSPAATAVIDTLDSWKA